MNITPCCGNEACEDEESCSTCPKDCCTFRESEETIIDFYELISGMTPVLGRSAPAIDVVSLSEIVESMQKKGVKLQTQKFADEIAAFEEYEEGTPIKAKYLIIGSPCDNKAAASIYSSKIESNGDCAIFPRDTGIIEIVKTADFDYAKSIMITGNTGDDVRRAARVIKEFEKYKRVLEGKRYVRVTGSLDNLAVN